MPAEKQRKIVREIKRLHLRGEPLNITAVSRNHPELIEAVYAVTPFWGWRNALGDAGLDYGRIETQLLQSVECKLCGREYSFLTSHLRLAHEWTTADYLQEYPGEPLSCEERRARQTGVARLHVPHWEPLWTAEYTLDRLKFLSDHGYAMHEFSVAKREPSLTAMAVRFWGSWDKALLRIGLDPRAIRRARPSRSLTRADILKAIRARHAMGLTLEADGMCHGKNADARLYRWACRRLGGWPRALVAAGMDFADHDGRQRMRTYRSRAEIMAAIRKRRDEELPLNARAVSTGARSDGALYVHGRREFGSWEKAVEAVGLRYAAIYRGPQPSYPTRQSVLEQIRLRHAAGQAINSASLGREGGLAAMLYKYGKKWFGSWRRALRMAGLDPCAIYQKRKSVKYPTPESIGEGIRRRQIMGLPLNARAVLKGPDRDGPLYYGARRVFGQWSEALKRSVEAVDKMGMPVSSPLGMKFEKRRNSPA